MPTCSAKPSSFDVRYLLLRFAIRIVALSMCSLSSDMIATTKNEKHGNHAKFTKSIVSALSPSGLSCIIAYGLFAFSWSAERLKRVVQQRAAISAPIAFIFHLSRRPQQCPTCSCRFPRTVLWITVNPSAACSALRLLLYHLLRKLKLSCVSWRASVSGLSARARTRGRTLAKDEGLHHSRQNSTCV
jgi:hypothetical protein